MPVTISGSTGITNVDGSAGTPAEKGATSSTAGVFFPAADTVGISTASTERVRVGSAGQIGIAGANYGTSGQVLTSGGASAAPSWATPAATGVNVQTFTGSGTWTKPAYAAGSRVLIQAWGAGGSGGKNSGAGGGGGGYNERWLTLSSMGATETITIGAGGAAKTTNGSGNQGGDTTAGSWVTAYGGAGGGSGSNPSQAGGGGGQLSAASGTIPGGPLMMVSFVNGTGSGDVAYYVGQGYANYSLSSDGYNAFNHGGGGGAGVLSTGIGNGGKSVWGGGGGGGGTNSGSNSTGGSSSFGGAGGAGGGSSNSGTAGTQPGGAGGGCGSSGASSGAGAAGQVIITVFPA